MLFQTYRAGITVDVEHMFGAVYRRARESAAGSQHKPVEWQRTVCQQQPPFDAIDTGYDRW